ncbi:hypothetical protein VTO42DRAFT_68 [Malbranchea cinnamomea]
MDAEAQPVQDHDFSAPQWVDLGGFNQPQHHSPMQDFNPYVFGSSPVMQMEQAYSMSIPQPYTAQQLLPLTMPPPWPGIISTQPGFAPVPLAPIPPMQSLGAPQRIHTPHFPTAPTPRRTLTDADRRRMCLYHEENPNVKQTEIGAMFGVERSTVSKVLRQKEKYLYSDDGNRSPIKKSKGKFPDIERALSNWVRNYQRQGGQLSDAMIREKALFFASTVGGPDNHQKIMSSSWLEKFKQKNCLTGSMSRKGSIDIANGVESTSNENSVTQTPSGLSPVTPSAATSPPPVSPKQEQDGVKAEGTDGTTKVESVEFASSLPQHIKSASTSSEPPIFSSENPFASSGQSATSDGESPPKRSRSQTFPITTSESALVSSVSSRHVSPKATPAGDEADQSPTETAAATVMKRNPSNPEIKTSLMQPPPLPKSNTMSPVSSPSSPTQDEARKALELVMNYFQNQPSGLAAQDFFTIGKLMEKLELAQSQAAAIAPAQPTSLQRIDEYPDHPRVCKKRSIHTL